MRRRAADPPFRRRQGGRRRRQPQTRLAVQPARPRGSMWRLVFALAALVCAVLMAVAGSRPRQIYDTTWAAHAGAAQVANPPGASAGGAVAANDR